MQLSGLRDWRGAIAALVALWVTTAGALVGGADAAPVFGLAAILLICGAVRRQWPSVDRPLAAIALMFLLLCWCSALWSIDPRHTLRSALAMTGALAAGLVLLGERETLAPSAPTILRMALIGASIGVLIILAEFLFDFPLMSRLLPPNATPHNMGTKIDRGLSYFAILIWPILAQAWRERRRLWAVGLGALAVLVVVLSYGWAAQVSAAAGILAFALALALPRVVGGTLSVLAAMAALATPFLVVAYGTGLMPFALRVKLTALHRLEIWDYMSRRALERPWSGWGWASAHALPIHPDELARYTYVTPAGTPHPHGNWVQLWVETGVAGPLLGLAFALLMIWRAWRLPSDVRPFALAACAMVFVMSLASFDLATDSWWAALAMAGTLFAILPKDRAAN